MEFVVKKISDIALKAYGLFADNIILLKLVAFPCCTDIADNKEKNYKQSEYSI